MRAAAHCQHRTQLFHLKNIEYNAKYQCSTNTADAHAASTRDNKVLHMQLLQQLANSLQITDLDQWYSVTSQSIAANGGRRLLHYYEDSLHQTLVSLHPEFPWKPWFFNQVPRNYWQSRDHQLYYLEWLATQLNIKSMEDWYEIKIEDVKYKGGRGLLKHYGESFQKVLMTIYNEYDWKPWLFDQVSVKFWDNHSSQKQYLEWVQHIMNIQSLDEFYNIKLEELTKIKGFRMLLSRYNNSLKQALMTIYPNHNWKPWLFVRAEDGYWDNLQNCLQYAKWLEERLCITTPTDWYDVSRDHIIEHKGRMLLSQTKDKSGLLEILQRLYPKQQWEEEVFVNSTLKTQKLLFRMTRHLLRGEEKILFNYTHPSLRFETSQINVTFDIYIPSLKVAIEYHGMHHYQYTEYFGSHLLQQQRDEEKKEICAAANITMIEISYQWKFDLDSLHATLHAHRPDIVSPPPPGAKPLPSYPENLEDPSLQQTQKQQETTTELQDARDIATTTLKQLYGMNEILLSELLQKGCNSINDMQKPEIFNTLPKAVQLAIQYFSETSQQIPRNEITEIGQIVKQHLSKISSSSSASAPSSPSFRLSSDMSTNNDILMEICGSYRRGAQFSGDIDILIKGKESEIPATATETTTTTPNKASQYNQQLLIDLIKSLTNQNIILADLSFGESIYNGICRLNDKSIARRIDIRVCSPSEWACSLIYFTGSVQFNISLRNWAKKTGYHLNQYHLYKMNEELTEKLIIPTNTEEEVFEILKLPMRSPTERNI